ncbi:21330_t:CDS:1, partial [Dentiscutata erythropus]
TNTNPSSLQNTNTDYTDTSTSSNTTNSVLTTNKPPDTNTVPRPNTPTNQITQPILLAPSSSYTPAASNFKVNCKRPRVLYNISPLA